MPLELPPLPYPLDALAPHVSKETLEFHYGKHHAGYVNKVNAAIEGTAHAEKTLDQLIQEKVALNAAAQTWNHTFYWQSMKPGGGGPPYGPIADAIRTSFGDFPSFKQQFSDAASGHFGSGWAWLVQTGDGKLEVMSTHDAGTPACQPGLRPLLTCDVWEHAYYIDYRNARGSYVEAWWKLVNWDFANQNLGA